MDSDRGAATWARAARGRRGLPGRPGPRLGLLALLVAGVVAAFGLLLAFPQRMPQSPFILLLVLGGFSLRRREFLVLSAVVAVLTVTAAVVTGRSGRGQEDVVPAVACVLLAVPVMTYLVRSRYQLGLPGDRPETLLLEMRRRLATSTHLPALPPPWRVEAHVETAHGQSFGGDVVVSSAGERTFEVAVVDVAGNGLHAAARSTQLTGALGALIGSVPPGEFVSRANDYVVRQGWDDGLATIVHVAVDLDTGRYTLSRAGHPAPLVLRDGGLWSFLEGASSTPLGVVEGAVYPRLSGLLGPGDAIVLYSDGLVESRHVPSSAGAERLLRDVASVTSPFVGAAERLASAAPSGDEDRTVVCLWRADTD